MCGQKLRLSEIPFMQTIPFCLHNNLVLSMVVAAVVVCTAFLDLFQLFKNNWLYSRAGCVQGCLLLISY